MAVVAPAAHMDTSGRLCSLSSYNNLTWSYVYVQLFNYGP